MLLKPLFVCWLTAFICAVFPSLLIAKEVIRIASGDWAPYLSQNLQHGGLATDIVRHAFARVGVETEFGYFPWKRSYRYAVNGKGEHGETWHATSLWLYSDERNKELEYSDAVIETQEVLFYLKSDPIIWENDSDLKGLLVGGTEYTPYPKFEGLQKQGILKLIRAGDDDKSMQRLIFRNLDAVIIMKEVGFYYLQHRLDKERREQIAYLPKSAQDRKMYLLFSRNRPENQKLIKLFNKGLKLIKQEGRYEELYQKFREGNYSHIGRK
ncbi:substrate-binding periplasmic protein [Vibrio sp. SCSIO 43137]|uniref:substrate-binding periplasmic protein n=1 Tax=Vibrio sp. SCSIO 43137 TaxID=3021011 RepID=UPI0023070121|nr:transporter substrate-binding domain-containing protein [Vibrio sp. SCSIO 43137]WCE30872.1 transporter substrate-binding domain-containing protein [Vibrio sp. SCSIO 43137]